MNKFEKCGFLPAEIFLPADGIDMSKWSCIACDQYTSNQKYWDRAEDFVGDAPSALKLVLPEIYLNSSDVSDRIARINETMDAYLQSGTLKATEPCYVLVLRTLPDGSVRKGIVGMIDLEMYDFSKDSQSKIRPTEGTIADRIPPRLRIRENASLELPHVMVLIDDDKRDIIESLCDKKDELEKLYDFELMQNGGHLTGYKIIGELAEQIAEKLTRLADREYFNSKYNSPDKAVLQYAVGDGNHSLATAKSHYQIKRDEKSRYALCELVNLHDDSLVFEAIHRTVFKTDTKKLIDELYKEYPNAKKAPSDAFGAHNIEIYGDGEKQYFSLEEPPYKLTVATLQSFLDKYLKENAGEIDYIHGEDECIELSKNEGAVSFILPSMKKTELFGAVISDGALPRKTFSMGDADTKRFYTEARRIK